MARIRTYVRGIVYLSRQPDRKIHCTMCNLDPSRVDISFLQQDVAVHHLKKHLRYLEREKAGIQDGIRQLVAEANGKTSRRKKS